MTDAHEQLARLAALPEPDLDLGQGALAVAAIQYPDLDPRPWLARLDALADAARPRLPATGDADARIAALSDFLYGEVGFRGNRSDYYDPRNSFLNDVLERKTGIPITLAVVCCEVARRLGLPLVGVAFPGHFLVRHEEREDLVIDPFSGHRLGHDDCQRLLDAVTGGTRELEGPWLRAARPREILARMLRNLKLAWMRQNEADRALAATDGVLLFAPDDPGELRDRGALYLRLECFAPALRDLERFLELAPEDPQAARVRGLLPDLHRRVAQLQ